MKRTKPVIGDLLDILPDAVVMVDSDGQVAFANPAVRRVLGYEPEELIGQPLARLLPPEVRERHASMVQRYRHDGQPTQMGARPVLSALHRSGRQIPVSISLCNLVLDGEALSVAVIHDVSVITGHLDRALRDAQTDSLTQLGNRAHLSQRIRAMLDAGGPFALLFIDLTQFKAVNDHHGHETGDQVLRIAAKRLASQVRGGDLAARVGGDEFVMLLAGLSMPDSLADRAASVSRHLGRPLRLGELSLNLGASIGAALFPRDGQTETALLAAADRRMYEAKRSGKAYRIDDDEAAPAARA